MTTRPHNITSFRRLAKLIRRQNRTPEEAFALHKQRLAEKPAQYEPKLARLPYLNRVLNLATCFDVMAIPLGSRTRQTANQVACAPYPRRTRWVTPQPTTYHDDSGTFVNTVDRGPYSRRCRYHMYDYHIYVTSYVILISEQRALARVVNKWVHLRAPRGWVFGRDDHGFCVARRTRRDLNYHPTSDDIDDVASGARIRLWCTKARENWKARKRVLDEERAARKLAVRSARDFEKAVHAAESDGMRVCIRDAMEAGNCVGGITQWGSVRGWQPGDHIRPRLLLRILTANANNRTTSDESRRIRATLRVALRRHDREMETGIAFIAYHRFP